jgi:hypothetical protein
MAVAVSQMIFDLDICMVDLVRCSGETAQIENASPTIS